MYYGSLNTDVSRVFFTFEVLWSVLGHFQFIESPVGSTPESKLIHLLIVRSIHAAYKQVS